MCKLITLRSLKMLKTFATHFLPKSGSAMMNGLKNFLAYLFFILTAVSYVKGVEDVINGYVPVDLYSSGPYLVRNVHEAATRCNDFHTCAGISYRQSENENATRESLFDVYVHGFIPFILQNESPEVEPTWKTIQSRKRFSYHVVDVTESTEDQKNPDLFNYMSIEQAEDTCAEKMQSCVGFQISLDKRILEEDGHERAFADRSQLFSIEVARRMNVNVYVDQWAEDSVIYKIKFLNSIRSVAPAQFESVHSVEILTAIRNTQIVASSKIELDAHVDGDIAYDNIELSEKTLLDPTGFCCHSAVQNSDGEMQDDFLTGTHISIKDTIERISCNISRDEFMAKYEQKRIPVVLVGCEKQWPASKLWKPSLFEKRFQNETKFKAIKYSHVPDLEFSHKADIYSWETILNQKTENKEYVFPITQYYISQGIAENDEIGLFDEFTTPLQFPDHKTSLLNDIPRYKMEFSPYFFLYYGKRFSSSPLHRDFCQTDAWNTLLYGSKWWLIIPPGTQNGHGDYRCDNSCSSKINGEAWFNTAGRVIDSFNFKHGKRAQHLVQKAGETFYLPNEYMHTTFSFEDSTAVSAGFLSEFNFHSFWDRVMDEVPIHDQKRLYYTKLSKEQRKIVRSFNRFPLS